MCGCRGASGLLLRWLSVAGLWLHVVDFQQVRIRTPWAWCLERNDGGLSEVTSAASRLRADWDSLRVRVAHCAARNQALGL